MRIKELRIALGYSQKFVADSLSISYSAFSYYENGKREPKIGVLIKLAEFFNCTLDELVKGEGKE